MILKEGTITVIALPTNIPPGGQGGFYFKLLLFQIGEFFKNPLQRYNTLRASLTLPRQVT